MKISFGKIIITPKNNGKNVPMAGYTRSFPAHGKLDDLYARSMMIETKNEFEGKNQVLLISLDLLKIPLSVSEYVKKKLTRKFGLKAQNILIHATHTHSAPDLTGEFYWPGGFLNVFRGIMFGANRNDRYIVYFTRLIVKMVEQLISNLEPAQIAFAKEMITTDILINRRNPLRHSQKDLWILVCKSLKSQQITGIIGNFPMHPTTLSYLNDKLSADYPGRFCDTIETESRKKISAMFITGGAGDLNPITTCGTDFERLEKDPIARQSVYEQFGTYNHTKSIGKFLGRKALKLAYSIPNEKYFNFCVCKSKEMRISIPIQDKQPVVYNWQIWIKNKLLFLLKRGILFPIASLSEVNFPGMSFERSSCLEPFQTRLKRRTIIQLIQIELLRKKYEKSKTLENYRQIIRIFGVPGEVFENLATELRQMSMNSKKKSSYSLIFQNSNDWVAYLFNLDVYLNEGGYEPVVSATPIAGIIIKRAFKKLLKRSEFNDQVQIQ